MLHPITFIEHIQNSEQQQPLMARIALNAIYDADAYPVDISELDKLSSFNRSIVTGFMNWCAVRQQEKYNSNEYEIEDLQHLASLPPKVVCQSAKASGAKRKRSRHFKVRRR